MRAVVVALCAAACGHAAPRGSWIEEDAAPGRSHASAASSQPAPEARPRPRTRADAIAAFDRAREDLAVVIAAGDLAVVTNALDDAQRARAWAAIDRLDPAALDRAYAAIDATHAPAAAIAVRRAAIAHHGGDDALARAWLDRARADDDPPIAPIAASLRASLTSAAVDPALIAVLVPRTGRFAALGAELEAAIRLADPQGARLVVLDTAGDPAQAAAQVDRAASLGAIAILGPVGEREAQAAARRAAERDVPIALLAPGDGADATSGVFRLVTSPADEARLAADAAAAQGFPSVAVLAPRDDVGDAMADAFVARAKEHQLDVTGDGRYDPTASDLEPDVKAFLGLDPARNPRLAAHLRKNGRKGWQTFVPDVPFSLLYVPDAYDRAALVAAFLPYFGVELRTTEIADVDALRRKYHGRVPQVVQLLGSSGWNHPALVTRGGSAVEGALIVDVFAGDRDNGPAAAFATAFHDATGRDPSSAAAQAYDAARLLLVARAATRSRTELMRALATARLDDGACGAASIVAGEIVRTPVLLQVDSGELVLSSD